MISKKILEVTFTLEAEKNSQGNITSQPVFTGTTSNSVTLSGYRASAHIVKAGGTSMGECQLKIYGMSLSLMNQLSTLGRTPVIIGRNFVTVTAGDSKNGMGLVFKGTISQAYTDLGSAPDSAFMVNAFSGLVEAMMPIPPTSYQGSADAAVIMSGLATQMNLAFENNGVSVMLSNPYFPGSARSQAEACAKAAGIDWIIDLGILSIWPKGGSRGGAVPAIGPDSGMIGYPFPSGQGLLGLRCFFNSGITFGGKIAVMSSIQPATGTWTICHVEHDIDCELPNGNWMTTVAGTPPNYLIRVS